jgi:hypothetical protein
LRKNPAFVLNTAATNALATFSQELQDDAICTFVHALKNYILSKKYPVF